MWFPRGNIAFAQRFVLSLLNTFSLLHCSECFIYWIIQHYSVYKNYKYLETVTKNVDIINISIKEIHIFKLYNHWREYISIMHKTRQSLVKIELQYLHIICCLHNYLDMLQSASHSKFYSLVTLKETTIWISGKMKLIIIIWFLRQFRNLRNILIFILWYLGFHCYTNELSYNHIEVVFTKCIRHH